MKHNFLYLDGKFWDVHVVSRFLKATVGPWKMRMKSYNDSL